MFSFLAPSLADLIVLAVDTAQVAVTKKDVANPVCPDETWLFPKVRCVGRDNRKIAGITPGDFILETIIPAFVRTNSARGEHCLKSLGAALKFACCV